MEIDVDFAPAVEAYYTWCDRIAFRVDGGALLVHGPCPTGAHD